MARNLNEITFRRLNIKVQVSRSRKGYMPRVGKRKKCGHYFPADIQDFFNTKNIAMFYSDAIFHPFQQTLLAFVISLSTMINCFWLIALVTGYFLSFFLVSSENIVSFPKVQEAVCDLHAKMKLFQSTKSLNIFYNFFFKGIMLKAVSAMHIENTYL